ncbi:hypothetical protein D9M70_562470 [compost metagenome]
MPDAKANAGRQQVAGHHRPGLGNRAGGQGEDQHRGRGEGGGQAQRQVGAEQLEAGEGGQGDGQGAADGGAQPFPGWGGAGIGQQALQPETQGVLGHGQDTGQLVKGRVARTPQTHRGGVPSMDMETFFLAQGSSGGLPEQTPAGPGVGDGGNAKGRKSRRLMNVIAC